VIGAGEDLSGSFNELSGSDNIDKKPDGCCIILGEVFINSFRILDIEASRLNKGLVFYFLNDGEVVSGGSRDWRS